MSRPQTFKPLPWSLTPWISFFDRQVQTVLKKRRRIPPADWAAEVRAEALAYPINAFYVIARIANRPPGQPTPETLDAFLDFYKSDPKWIVELLAVVTSFEEAPESKWELWRALDLRDLLDQDELMAIQRGEPFRTEAKVWTEIGVLLEKQFPHFLEKKKAKTTNKETPRRLGDSWKKEVARREKLLLEWKPFLEAAGPIPPC